MTDKGNNHVLHTIHNIFLDNMIYIYVSIYCMFRCYQVKACIFAYIIALRYLMSWEHLHRQLDGYNYSVAPVEMILSGPQPPFIHLNLDPGWSRLGYQVAELPIEVIQYTLHFSRKGLLQRPSGSMSLK